MGGYFDPLYGWRWALWAVLGYVVGLAILLSILL